MTIQGEEAAELIATIRGEHVVMKTWFQSDHPEATVLRSKYGDYPSLWKGVLNWKGWKDARRAYLKYSQTEQPQQSQQQQQQQELPTQTIKQEPTATNQSMPRKRKSRWGSASSGPAEPAPRKSRWASAPSPAPPKQPSVPHPPPSNFNRPKLPGLPGLTNPQQLPPQQQRQLRELQGKLRQLNDRLNTCDAEAARVDALPRGHRERSPSPPPIYGADGKRKNTRAVRWRERWTQERQDLLEQLMNLNPATRHNSLFRRKRTVKIPIPIEQHPNYNFIGLIIGPRGKTQKELEAKTGCKIAIRGKGSVKEGARGRRDGKVMEGDNEPLHVVITGEDQKSVDAATDMIKQMLVVIDDEKNVHKQTQLRELALLNGTLKEEEFCQICAEKGHRAFECPKRFSQLRRSGAGPGVVAVKCAICGDTSHPTRDCTQRRPGAINAAGASGAGGQPKDAQQLDSDYASFMAELDGKKVEQPKKPEEAPAPPAEPVGVTVIKPATVVPTPPQPNTSLPTPPPPVGLPRPPPPPPNGLPPPPLPAAGAPPPPLPGATAAAAVVAPGYPQQQQQQQQYRGYNHYQQGGTAAHNQRQDYHQQYNHQQQYGQQQQHYGQQQQYQQNQNGEYDETAGWDYRSYYAQASQANSAGGFNWWEQN